MGATAVGLSCHFTKSMAQAWGATSSTPNTETKEKLTKTPNKPPLKKIAPEAKSLISAASRGWCPNFQSARIF